MKNTLLHFLLSVLTPALVLVSPLRGANVLYFRDAPIGPDRAAEAFGALGHIVTFATDAGDFQTQLESGAYELGVIFVQSRPAAEYASAIAALSAFVENGGRALYADWSRNAALAAGFGASFTGSGDERSVTSVNLYPARTVVPDSIKLRNTGWFRATSGLDPLGGSTVAATFSSGAAAIVRGPSGRSLVFGFLGDTPENAAIFARGAEAVLAPADSPLVFFTDDPATPAVHSVTLRGFVVPTNATTTFSVEYGLTANYGAQGAPQTIAGGYSPVSFATTLENLAPHTTYHYRFRASNLAGSSSSADRTFTTLNTPPIAQDDHATVSAKAITFQPLANDTDDDGDALAIVAVTAGEFGSVSFDVHTLTYTPAVGGLRGDSFTYTVSDGFGGSATATVFLNVTLAEFRGDYTQLLVGTGGRIIGRLTFTLGSGGAFTGRMLLDGRSDSIMGVFGWNGSAHFVKARPGARSATFDLQLQFVGNEPRIAGAIFDGLNTFSVSANAVLYDAAHPPPFARNGHYTLAVLESRNPQVPRGEAWAVFAGDAEGRLILTGRFADGELFSGATQVQPDGTLPLYLLRASRPVEALAGTLRFDTVTGHGFEGELAWTRLPTDDDAGFSVFSSVVGGRFHPPAENERILNFPDAERQLAQLKLFSNVQDFPVKQTFLVGTRRLAPLIPKYDDISLQFSRTTGQFTGSFNHPTLGLCYITGVLLQQENIVRGNFFGNGFSGGMRLTPR